MMKKFFLPLIVALQFVAHNVIASEEKFHDQYVEWALFSNVQGSEKICYIVSLPIKREGYVQNRGEPHFIITKTKDKLPEVSISAGYHYKKNSEVELSFGLKKYSLIAYKGHAWSYHIDDDIEIIKALRSFDTMIVKAISDDNKETQDTYAFIGFNKAYDHLNQLCE